MHNYYLANKLIRIEIKLEYLTGLEFFSALVKKRALEIFTKIGPYNNYNEKKETWRKRRILSKEEQNTSFFQIKD